MAESSAAETQAGGPLIIRLTPLLAGILAGIVALVAATLRGLPLPLDVAGVFVVIGLAATWIARRSPLSGAVFVALVAIVAIAVAYSG